MRSNKLDHLLAMCESVKSKDHLEALEMGVSFAPIKTCRVHVWVYEVGRHANKLSRGYFFVVATQIRSM